MKLKFSLSANGYERLFNGKDHFKSYFITDDFEKEIDMENVFIYLSASDPNGTWCAVAEAHDGDFGKTSVYFGPACNPKQFKADIPTDYCCGLYILEKNLLIIYQRSITIIKNAFDGNLTPEQEPFIEMQDYYGYEPPQIVCDNDHKIWCSIGGRMFFKNNVDDKWTETDGFHIGDSEPVVTKNGLIIYSTNYQYDTKTEGLMVFDTADLHHEFRRISGLGKSPVPLIEIVDGVVVVANASQPSKGSKTLVAYDTADNQCWNLTELCGDKLPVAIFKTDQLHAVMFFTDSTFKKIDIEALMALKSKNRNAEQPCAGGLARYCRYYGVPGGAERNTAASFYEERWVNLGGIYPLDEYVEYGLMNFSEDDGVPITLKAMLFNRYHTSNGFYPNISEMFKEWYERFYLCSINE